MKILLKENQNVWFTSDTHYNHTNICRGTTQWSDGCKFRDFDTLNKMNDTIVNNINSFVGQDDILFHLGDWSFGGFDSIKEFRDRIVCKNIHLILGNHDHHIVKNRDNIQDLFESVTHYRVVTFAIDNGRNVKQTKYTFILSHFPFASWQDMGDGSFHLYGHMHSKPVDSVNRGRSMDVGMDSNNLSPIRLENIITLLKDRPKIGNRFNYDQHEKY